MTLEVKKVTTRRHLRDFLEVAERLNSADPIWIPQLRQDFARSLSLENPFFQDGIAERDLFVAYRGKEPVGRVLAHIHHASNRLHQEQAGFWGFLECPDDLQVASALFDAVSARHKTAGMTQLRGPYELAITSCLGAVVKGFDEPAAFLQSWNPPHHPALYDALGFQVVYRAATYRLDDVQTIDTVRLMGEKQRVLLQDPSVKLRGFDMDHFERDLGAATRLLNASFKGNFGFVPLNEKEVAFLAGPMKRIVRPELTVFLELGGEPVGVGLLLPDFNVLFKRMKGELFPLGWAKFLLGAKSLDRAVGSFIATSPAHQNKGLMRIVLAELVKRMQELGFRTLDGTWIGDVNAASLASVKSIGMREKHRLQLYARPL